MFSLHVDTARTWRGGQNQVLLTVDGLRAIGHRAALVAHPDGELRRRAAALSPSERDRASERGRGWAPGRMETALSPSERDSASERGRGWGPGRMEEEDLELVPLAPRTEMDFTAAWRFARVVRRLQP